MVALYVTSLERSSGKTAVCAGIGKHLLDDGKKIGFIKPVITDNKNPKPDIDGDAAFMKHTFALAEPLDSLCPVIGGESNLPGKIKDAFAKVSPGKDVVIIEGIHQPGLVEALDARVIIVEGYSKELPKAKLVDAGKDFGKRLMGLVLNKVPRNQVEHVREEMSTPSGKDKINILGVLPEERALLTLTIGELAEHIQGEILGYNGELAELAENFMLGALCVDPGPDYFGRKANKVVIVRGERPDMQLAALETSTRCLVLSGNTAPIPAVLQRAEVKKVPIILARDDTATIVAGVEDALGKTRFNQERKLPKIIEIMEPHFDFKALYRELGLTG